LSAPAISITGPSTEAKDPIEKTITAINVKNNTAVGLRFFRPKSVDPAI